MTQATAERSVQVKMALPVYNGAIEAMIPVPAGPVRPIHLLPLFQALTDRVVNLGERVAVQEGGKISCKAGCGACCRQLVPISETEARRVAELVEEMPEPRRTEIRRRFVD